MSLALHGCAVTLLFTVLSKPAIQVKVRQAGGLFVPVISFYFPEAAPKPKTLQGRGGGGDGSLMSASKGRAPKFAARQFVPPAAVVNHENPKLLLDPTLIGHPEALVAKDHLTV